MKETRIFETVARSIIDMIEFESYPVGTRLPSERDLAVRFGVSRAVIRDAEKFLETAGRLEIKRGSGVYVEHKSAAGMRLQEVTAFGLTQTRYLFESECAALAATVITDDQIAALDATIEKMAVAPVNSAKADNADHKFHLLLAKATGNEANVAVLQNIWRMRNEIDAVKRVYAAVGHTDAADRVNEHIDIMDALRNRDPAAARKAMQRHFSRLLKALLDVSEEQALEDVRRKANEKRKQYMHHGLMA